MKRIIITVLLLIVVVLGAYFSTGLLTERTLKKNLTTLNQANGLSVDLVGYHRGLFKSTADLTWRMQLPEKVTKQADGSSTVTPARNYTFDMPLVVYHGPVMVEHGRVRFGLGAANGELSLPDAYMEEFQDTFSDKSTKPKLFIGLFVTYLNKTHLEAKLPAFQLVTKKDDAQFEWLGMNSDLRFSPQSTRLQGHFNLDGLRLMSKRFRLILNKVTSAYNVHKAENGLFLGDANLALPILQVTDKNQTEFELKQLELNSGSAIDDGDFSSSFHGAFDTLISRDRKYGPGELSLSVKHLDADVLASLNQRINQLDTAGGQAQQALLSLLPDLPKLLSRGALFEISKLRLVLPEGVLEGALSVAFPKTDTPLQVFSKVEGNGHLTIPAAFLKATLTRSFKHKLIEAEEVASAAKQRKDTPKRSLAPAILNAEPNKAAEKPAQPVTMAELDQQAVQQADQKLADLIRVGALKAKGSDYVLELKLASGRLLVNGRPFHSGMLSF